MLRLLCVFSVLFSCAVASSQDSSIEELKARVALLVADTGGDTVSDGSDFADRILSKMEASRSLTLRPSVTADLVDSAEDKPPHLTAVLWDSGCPYGEAWYKDAYPLLKEKGWRIDVRRVPSGHTPCPSFVLGDEHWSGYKSRKAHFAKLNSILHPETAESAVAEADYYIEEPPQVEQRPVQVRRSIPPARQQWSYYGGGSLASHLRSHGIDPTGMSYQDMVNAHSHAHEGTWSSVNRGTAPSQRPVRYTVQPVRYQQGPIRRLFSGGCPNGMCP